MTRSGSDVQRAPAIAVPRWRRGHMAAYVFLAALVAPVSEIIAGRTRSTGLAAGALIAFVICFVLVVELGLGPRTVAVTDPVIAMSRARRWLVRGLSVALIGLAIAATMGFGRGFVVLFIFVVSTAVFTLPVRWAVPAMFAVASIAVATELSLGWNATSAATAASWALSILMTGFVSLLLRRRTLLINELRAAQGEVARLAADDAVVEERLRFARDLHDLLGHSLSVIVLKAELARRLLERDAERGKVQAEVGDLEQIARRALDEVREAVTGYRARSLAAELAHARVALEAAGVDVHTRVVAPALPPDIDDLLAWVVRETATNIVRHGSARRADIELTVVDGVARLEVCNDSIAAAERAAGPELVRAAPGGNGSGLVGLRERVAEAGGQLTPESVAGGGFRVLATVPLGAAPVAPSPPAVPPGPARHEPEAAP